MTGSSRAPQYVGRNWTTPMNEPLTYIYVTWRDAHSGTTTWTQPTEIDPEPCIVRTSGFLLAESEGGKPEHITVFQSITPDGDIDHVLHIPVKMIVDFKCVQVDFDAGVVITRSTQ